MSNVNENGAYEYPDRTADRLEDVETRIQMGLDYDLWEAGAEDDRTWVEIIEVGEDVVLGDERVLNFGRAI